jgi:hypothetical protein
VKLHCLRLTFSFSSELEESSLEKLKSLKAAYARDMIFCNFFLSLKWYFFFIVALVAGVVSVVIVVLVLVGGVELLPLGAVGDEVGDIDALEAARR